MHTWEQRSSKVEDKTAASLRYAIDTHLVTTNAWILCNETKTAFVVGKIPSVI